MYEEMERGDAEIANGNSRWDDVGVSRLARGLGLRRHLSLMASVFQLR